MSLDTTSPVTRSRFETKLDTSPSDSNEKLGSVHTYFVPSLIHLLALIVHPPASFSALNAGLLVIDDLDALFDLAYPRIQLNGHLARTDAAKRTTTQRYNALASLITALNKVAAINDMAIIVITGCGTRLGAGDDSGAMTVPGLGSLEWNSGITNKLVIFRDHAPLTVGGSQTSESAFPTCVRFIGVQKLNGISFGDDGDIGQMIAFDIYEVRHKHMKWKSRQEDISNR